MGEVDQNLKTLADDVVTLFSADARNQPHPARIMFIVRMIETLWLRNTAATI
jgi:hypothetical protein